jgi:hypothetical protein
VSLTLNSCDAGYAKIMAEHKAGNVDGWFAIAGGISDAFMEVNAANIVNTSGKCPTLRHPLEKPERDTPLIMSFFRSVICDPYERFYQLYLQTNNYHGAGYLRKEELMTNARLLSTKVFSLDRTAAAPYATLSFVQAEPKPFDLAKWLRNAFAHAQYEVSKDYRSVAFSFTNDSGNLFATFTLSPENLHMLARDSFLLFKSRVLLI